MAIVYLLRNKDGVVYVGMAKNEMCAHNRVYCHERDKIFDSVEFIKCSKDDVMEIENNLILNHAPKYNKLAKGNENFATASEFKEAIGIMAFDFLESKNIAIKLGVRGYVDLSEININGFGDFATHEKIKEKVIEIRDNKNERKVNAPIERENRLKEIRRRSKLIY